MKEIAEKIENKTATEKEILAYTKEFNALLEKMKDEINA